MLRVAVVLIAATLLAPGVASAAPELSITDRLQDRRYVAAGERAQVLAFQDGRFYANGWHITGEMGGVWSQPLKLLDGVWFGVDGEWIGPAREFTSGWGYARMALPETAGLRVSRIDFVPEGRRAALFGLELVNRGAARTVTVSVDAHSELMTSYPWSFAGVVPNASDNLADSAEFDGRALVFRDEGRLPHPNAPEHHYVALVGSTSAPVAGETSGSANDFRGPQAGTVCDAASQEAPAACDDGPFGRGAGGQLRYELTLPAGRSTRLWVAVAGSEAGEEEARAELDAALADPERALAEKLAARARLGRWTQVSLPGDPRLARALDWGKQNLADLTQSARDLQLRYTNQGREFPPPAGTVPVARWIGAGFPDYPWIFATDAEYTAFASVALGQFEPIMDNLRTLRDISDIVNARSGKVVHEIVPEGSVWFGANSDPGNTDETVKFPSTVALVWRWTGDDGFRDDLYDFARRNLVFVQETLDADGDGWPEGLGNVERAGMGEEKLDNTVYWIRGLLDLADMAAAKGDGATESWASDLAQSGLRRFEDAWWMPEAAQYADSLDDPAPGEEGPRDVRVQQQHWIGVTPMEAELTIEGRAVPGLADREHGDAALAVREGDCFSGTRPYNLGLFHTGCGGGPTGAGERSIFSLNTAIQAVGEGNYGRLGADQQRRYTDANAEPMFDQPFTGGTPDEQPGALPEILPSPDFDATGDNDANILRCWTCRAMFMQAWGHYGTAWPVVHQHLGVRPDMGRGLLEVIPQLPSDAPIAGRHIRVGDGAVAVSASGGGDRYRTSVATGATTLAGLVIGHTLPRDARVRRVRLDGHRVPWLERVTNRGLEVTVATRPGRHALEVRTR